MRKINIRASKRKTVTELLLKTDRRRKHSLYLASCYFSVNAAEIIINDISASIKLSKVFIYIDRQTALRIGKDKLIRFCEMFDNLNVKIYAVDTNSLFHTKAYALISFEEDKPYCGSVVVGSANLTSNGVTGKYGNIESILDSQDVTILKDFLDQTENLKLLEIDEIDLFKSSEDFSFKYALIQEGRFIHKWTDSLDQYFSVRYLLNKNGRAKLANKDFLAMGFNMDTATIGKKYFNFECDYPYLEGAENLTRNYGIETYLGYWIPNSELGFLFEKDQLDFFKQELETQFKLQIEGIDKKIKDDLSYLKVEGLIEITDYDPVELLKNKLAELIENESKILRMFSKYEVFPLPYDISQRKQINDLFKVMFKFVESRKRKNVVMKAFLEATSNVSLSVFRDQISKNIT